MSKKISPISLIYQKINKSLLLKTKNKSSIKTIYIATSNQNKLREIKEILRSEGITEIKIEPINIEKIEIQSLDVKEVVETAASFITIFMPQVLRNDSIILLEDTGLSINALNGFPGALVKWTLETIGNEGILKLLEGKTERRAKMCTSVACIGCRSGIRPTIVTKCIEGEIAEEPRGDNGFGFDKIFIPNGSSKTLAEMDNKEKNKVSSRALAFKQIVNIIKTLQGI